MSLSTHVKFTNFAACFVSSPVMDYCAQGKLAMMRYSQKKSADFVMVPHCGMYASS